MPPWAATLGSTRRSPTRRPTASSRDTTAAVPRSGYKTCCAALAGRGRGAARTQAQSAPHQKLVPGSRPLAVQLPEEATVTVFALWAEQPVRIDVQDAEAPPQVAVADPRPLTMTKTCCPTEQEKLHVPLPLTMQLEAASAGDKVATTPRARIRPMTEARSFTRGFTRTNSW